MSDMVLHNYLSRYFPVPSIQSGLQIWTAVHGTLHRSASLLLGSDRCKSWPGCCDALLTATHGMGFEDLKDTEIRSLRDLLTR